MPQTHVRVVGSGFTTFNYRGKPIAFLESVSDSGQRVLDSGGGGAGWEAIYSLGSKHAEEIVTSRVLAAGTLTCSIRELWDLQTWQQLEGLASANDLASVYELLAREPSMVTCQLIITPPGDNRKVRGKTYMNCTVTGIGDAEAIEVGSLSVAKGLSIIYTHTIPL